MTSIKQDFSVISEKTYDEASKDIQSSHKDNSLITNLEKRAANYLESNQQKSDFAE